MGKWGINKRCVMYQLNLKQSYESSFLFLLNEILKAKRRACFSQYQLKEYQQSEFRKILKYVYENSFFYRELYNSYGIKFKDLDYIPITDLPFIDKELVMNNFDSIICDQNISKKRLEDFLAVDHDYRHLYKNNYHVLHTSGSSGQVGIFVYSNADWARLISVGITRVAHDKFSFGKRYKVAFVGASKGHFAGISLSSSVPKTLYDFKAIDIMTPFDEMIDILNEYQPDILTSYSSGADMLATAQIDSKLKINPSRVVCSADVLTKSMANHINKAFGVKPTCFYAATESVMMAVQEAGHSCFHIFDDLNIVELLGDDLMPVEPGQPGNCVITTLYNYTMPLIRYRMNDVLTRAVNCNCTYQGSAFACIDGRNEDYLWFELKDGKKEYIHPTVLIEFYAPGLEKFQFLQPKPNRLLMRAVSNQKDKISKLLRLQMMEILHSKGLDDEIDFDIQFVDHLDNNPNTGKFKLIHPLGSEEANKII